LSPFLNRTERYKKIKYKCNRQRDGQAERRTDRQTNSETRGQTDRQTKKHAERQTQRQIYEIKHFFSKWKTIEIAIFFREKDSNKQNDK
jgi:hypothetical protein